jgi:hypothetical protein
MAVPLCLVWLALVASAPASPATAPSDEAESREEGQRLTGASPVDIVPRLEVRQQFVAPRGGGALNTTLLRMDMEVLRKGLLRYELPLVVARTPDGQISGIGDIRLTALALLTSGRTQLAVVLAGVVLNTATRPVLGNGKDDVFVGGGAAVKPVPSWLLFAVLRQELSFAGEDARPDVNQLLVTGGSIYFGSRGDWYALELDTLVDFANHEARLLGFAEIGRLLVGRVGLFMRSGTHLLGDRNIDYSLEAGVRYLFRLEPK